MAGTYLLGLPVGLCQHKARLFLLNLLGLPVGLCQHKARLVLLSLPGAD